MEMGTFSKAERAGTLAQGFFVGRLAGRYLIVDCTLMIFIYVNDRRKV
jgi:hypothetical protein